VRFIIPVDFAVEPLSPDDVLTEHQAIVAVQLALQQFVARDPLLGASISTQIHPPRSLPEPAKQTPSIGRIVHLVMPNLEERPAIITRVLDDERGLVGLHIFFDPNDALWARAPGAQATFDVEGVTPGCFRHHPPAGRMESLTWHWPTEG
jgi:hypothetical protein